MIASLCPYYASSRQLVNKVSSGSKHLIIKNTFIEGEVEETTMTTSSRRAQSEPPMNEKRGLSSLDDHADGHVGAEKESTALSIITNTEDHTTDAGSMTPRSAYSTVDEGFHAFRCDSLPRHLPQNARQAIQEIAAASFIFQPHTFQSQTIVRVEGTSRDVCCIRLTVHAKKLSSSDTSVVSPQFELSNALGAPLPFKMILTPKAGSGSFKRAHGQGRMELKCLAPPDDVSNAMMTFWFSAGGGRGAEALQSPRGPVQHNFAQTGLSKDLEIWDFNGLVDKTSQTFVVCLAVLSPWH